MRVVAGSHMGVDHHALCTSDLRDKLALHHAGHQVPAAE